MTVKERGQDPKRPNAGESSPRSTSQPPPLDFAPPLSGLSPSLLFTPPHPAVLNHALS